MDSSQGAAWQRWLQSLLLGAFSLVRRTGILDSRVGRTVFEWCYERYKTLIEAGEIEGLAAFAKPGSLVIDVGANVGFFTTRFAGWVGPSGRVIAIEPEAVNFARLSRRIEAGGLAGRVRLIEGAACETEGTVWLQINPDHPGDHKLGSEGVPIRGVTLDGIASAEGLPPVSLIKIDVQGAEMRVLGGAGAVIKRCRPALFIEVDDKALRRLDASAALLIETVQALGYTAHRLEKRGVSPVLDPTALAPVLAGEGYLDLLFLPVPVMS